MNFITNKSLDRRTMLKGLGATIALPFLDAMMPARAAAQSRKIRLVAMEMVHGSAGSTAFGVTKNLWAPAATGSAFDLSPTSLAPLEPWREYITIVRAIFAREKALEYDGVRYQIPYRGPGATGLGKPLKSILHGRKNIPIYTGSMALD